MLLTEHQDMNDKKMPDDDSRDLKDVLIEAAKEIKELRTQPIPAAALQASAERKKEINEIADRLKRKAVDK